MKKKKKPLYCAFIDFEKAFDTVWRAGLWHKLLQNGIRGKCFNIIVNLYKNTKSLIKFQDSKSPLFHCGNRVIQGENLSPFPFSLYLNDLKEFMLNKNTNGLLAISKDCR